MVERHEDEEAPTARGKVGAALFLVIGIVVTAIGLWQCASALRLYRHGTATTGIITGDRSAGTMSRAHPEVEFRTAGGAVVRYTQNGMGARPIGSRVPVLYDPAAPAATAVVQSVWQFWLPPLLPLWIGLGFITLVLRGAKVELRGAYGAARKR